ncbi:C4-dicarboxylate ABC transporter [Methylobacter sp.]|uniref:C4-dicarboxylate ABC transporter n=1 Tax=Methylobacter sp. TaxID=2051955 RepID=UPI00248A5875|nr:C4-dicarboxylate ABC transporter [Methylobacter sp.]MDI1279085.1 C4-dicarboxylate ABC transporter [Methylobacter sp.]MDI1359892.1 C4-dicarboxylate ABC transporter [Methylobacter sp.]
MWRRFLEMTCRLPCAIVFILITPTAHALNSVSLNVGTIAGSQWKLEGVTIALTDLSQNPQKLALTIAKLSLPKPFNDLNLVNIRCTAFTWQNKEMVCEQGRAEMRSKHWQSPTANFSFHVTEKRSSFKLTALHLAGGIIAIDGEEQGELWQLQIDAKAVDGKSIQQLLPQDRFKLKGGKINVKLNASGSYARGNGFTLTAGLNGLTGQTKDGRLATEALVLESTLNAQHNNGLWQWQSHSDFNGGALYAEPLYIEAAGQNIILDAQGDWNASNKRVEIKSASYRHSKVGELSGSATVQYKDGASLEKAQLSLNSDNLQDLSAIYLKPFFEQTVLQGVTLAGHLKADFSINDQSLTALAASFNNLDVKDAAGRGEIQDGVGQLNWSNDETFSLPSKFAWQQLQVRAVPIGSAELSLLSRADSIRLLKKTQLPFLGGAIAINQFNWQAKKQQAPELSFEGDVSNVSLEQLSLVLNWTPLSGTISGHIPRVEYSNKTLSLGGELIVKVFNGEVKISNLASSGLFTDFPKFHSDLEIENLDLDQLTGKFKFGGITGKLSGYVRQLYMENWHPVTFFAWLGTPENDDSRHRISQKAVQNIANIGGGGAADLLSKSFLRFFETFGYDKLGLGCYLHDGVCQLMGVEARESGYAIITGGGLPRIDVIGYNPRVDWNVLMDRLKRISTSDEVIVE